MNTDNNESFGTAKNKQKISKQGESKMCVREKHYLYKIIKASLNIKFAVICAKKIPLESFTLKPHCIVINCWLV